MPSLREMTDNIKSNFHKATSGSTDRPLSTDLQEIIDQVEELYELVAPVVARYDYWRAMYAEKAGMSESDFDTMTDECIRHGASPGDECLHLVVTAGGYCANCGVNCRGR